MDLSRLCSSTRFRFLQVEFDRDGTATGSLALFFAVVQWITLPVFTAEAVLKVVSFGVHPMQYFHDVNEGAFNTFDLLIVLLSYALLGSNHDSLVLFCRLLRCVKIMSKLPQLRVILMGLVAGMRAVSSIMLLMWLVIFLYAIIGRIYFGVNDPSHYGTVLIGMLTLFRVATLASWGDVFKISYFGCDNWNAGVYSVEVASNISTVHIRTKFGHFIPYSCVEPQASPVVSSVFYFTFTVITAFVILSLFISVITAAMIEVTEVRPSVPRCVTEPFA